MAEPTSLTAFRDRVAKPIESAASGVEVREFNDAFEANFFDMLGLELSDAPTLVAAEHTQENDDEVPEEHENDPEILHRGIADSCQSYATQKIAALNAHFTSNTSEYETILLDDVNNFTKIGQTGMHRPITPTELSDMLYRCLVQTSTELLKTNIFTPPAIHR